MKLVRVVAPHFVAGFISDGVKVVRAAPILKKLVGHSEDYAREVIARYSWKASVIEVFDGDNEEGHPHQKSLL
jgi:hypothetical protein